MTDTIVLCYHAVSTRWPSELAVTPEQLEDQLLHLLGRGYRPTTFTQAIAETRRCRSFAVTFDDGYRSVAEVALPVMAKLGVVGTLFTVTSFIGSGRPMSWPGISQWVGTEHEDELLPVDWWQLERLIEAGWEVGSHTRTHPFLTRLPPARLREELAGSRADLVERLGSCQSVAYPYGDVNDQVADAARRVGYSAGATLPSRFPPRPQPHLWPRVGVFRDDTAPSFRRHTSRTMRRLQASPVWSAVRAGLPRIKAAREALTVRRPPTRSLRLISSQGRLVVRRPVVLARGLLARVGVGDAYALWPDPDRPLIIVGAGDAAAARWVQRTFEPTARRVARVDAATWNILRARALLVGAGSSPAAAAAGRALGRRLDRPRTAAFSPTGAALTKVTCFVFEGEAEEPTVVVKAMPEIEQAPRLRHEVEAVERLRARLQAHPELTAALPLAPLAQEQVGGDLVVVQPLDPLASFTGRADRDRALDWLRAFHAATQVRVEPWAEADREAGEQLVAHAWNHLRPHARESVVDALRPRTAALLEFPVPVCAVHGDYWWGNLAADGPRFRVYDWEWTTAEARPFVDIWTYELAELRQAAGAGVDDLEAMAAAALARVEDELGRRALPATFAVATVAPALAEFSFRVRRLTGRPSANEPGTARVMQAVENLLEP